MQLVSGLQLTTLQLESLIAAYIIQQKQCTLPGIGTLSIEEIPARADFVNKQVMAPWPQLRFSETALNNDCLPDYIAKKKQISRSAAVALLNNFCDGLKKHATLSIKNIGRFSTGHYDAVQFEPAVVPQLLLQSVEADRVIHPEAEHSMLVGDTETTNTAMAEYYVDEPVKKSRWWIAALALVVVATVSIVIYFSQGGKVI